MIIPPCLERRLSLIRLYQRHASTGLDRADAYEWTAELPLKAILEPDQLPRGKRGEQFYEVRCWPNRGSMRRGLHRCARA